jgi:hypothetical protein
MIGCMGRFKEPEDLSRMEKELITVQLNTEMDTSDAMAPRKDMRKVLGVNASEIMLQKTTEISQLL